MATRTARSVARSSSFVAASRKAAAAPAARPPAPPPPAPISLKLTAARAGDQPSIHAFLLSVFQGPTTAEFHAQLDEPGYLPADRLVVKHRDDIVAHLRLARQTIQAGTATLPAARFMDLATAPHLRGRGVATALLAAGERAAASRGVLLGITRTRVPSLFARHGWTRCSDQTYSTASPRSVLAELAAALLTRQETGPAPSFFQRPELPVIVRPLRRIELPAIVRLYEQQSRLHVGWPVRNEAHWEWLLARGACDRIYVASTAAQSPTFTALIESIVGYACVRQSRIVELVAVKGESRIAEHLLERLCADAREEDGWTIRYDAPPGDPLHALFLRAGGQQPSDPPTGEVGMVKLLDPLQALRGLATSIHKRALAAQLTLPAELGLDVRAADEPRAKPGILERFRIRVTPQQTDVVTGGPSRHSVILPMADLASLLLGDLSPASLANSGRLVPSTAKALTFANSVFSGQRWWRPILDDLLA